MQNSTPWSVQAALEEGYVRYFDTAFWLRDPGMMRERRALVNQSGVIFREPLLEALFPYENGRTLWDACAEIGIAREQADELARLIFGRDESGNYRDGTFRLRKHQEQALTTVLRCSAGPSNVVVTSGTGSGKTECFLLPIFEAGQEIALHAVGVKQSSVEAHFGVMSSQRAPRKAPARRRSWWLNAGPRMVPAREVQTVFRRRYGQYMWYWPRRTTSPMRWSHRPKDARRAVEFEFVPAVLDGFLGHLRPAQGRDEPSGTMLVFRGLSDPGGHRHERVTNADRVLQERIARFHISGTPKVTHLIAADLAGGQARRDEAAVDGG